METSNCSWWVWDGTLWRTSISCWRIHLCNKYWPNLCVLPITNFINFSIFPKGENIVCSNSWFFNGGSRSSIDFSEGKFNHHFFFIEFNKGDLWICSATLSFALYSLGLKYFKTRIPSIVRIGLMSAAGVLWHLPFTIMEFIFMEKESLYSAHKCFKVSLF